MCNDKKYSCTFIGHRDINTTKSFEKFLKDFIENLIISKGVKFFNFGMKGGFNSLCYDIVTNLQKKYTHIETIAYACLSEAPALKSNVKSNRILQKFLDNHGFGKLAIYDIVIYPARIQSAGKSSYVQRNYAMIDNSDYCVFFYQDEYVPKIKIRNGILHSKTSGTKIALKYATKKNKKIFIINEIFKSHY